MRYRRGKFLTFIFSCLPGAGFLYMGFMKRGLSILGTFFGLIALISCLNVAPLVYLIPVIWFYSFFEQMNTVCLPEEEFYTMEDNYIFEDAIFNRFDRSFLEKYHIAIAILLILLGLNVLLDIFFGMMDDYIPEVIRQMVYGIQYRGPQVIFAIFIIFVGAKLIQGKNQQLNDWVKQEEEKEEEPKRATSYQRQTSYREEFMQYGHKEATSNQEDGEQKSEVIVVPQEEKVVFYTENNSNENA